MSSANPHRPAAAALALWLACAAGAAFPGPAAAQSRDDDTMFVTLLGTGSPGLREDRFGPSTLVQAGGLTLLFDAGRGASIRLGQMGLTPGLVDASFLTHMHSDHVNGLDDIYMTGYIPGAGLKGRTTPFELYGPFSTAQLAQGILLAHRWDAETRIIDAGVVRAGTEIETHEAETGVAFDQDRVKVTVFPLKHGEKITDTVGYRVDYKDKSVLLSGDTTYDENVITFGKGADLLIHEVAAYAPSWKATRRSRRSWTIIRCRGTPGASSRRRLPASPSTPIS